MKDECEKIIKERGDIPIYTGECCYTTAGDLNSKHLIHTVGPVWYGGK